MAPWIEQNRLRPRVVVLAPPDKPRVARELQRLEPVIRKFAEVLAIDQKFEYQFEDCISALINSGEL